MQTTVNAIHAAINAMQTLTAPQTQIALSVRTVKRANVNTATLQLCATVSSKCKPCPHKAVCAVVYNTQLLVLHSATQR